MATSTNNETFLCQGNRALRAGNYAAAIRFYLQAQREMPTLTKIIAFNLDLAQKKIQTSLIGVESQTSASIGATLNILFVLHSGSDDSAGRYADFHTAKLTTQGANCLFAVPHVGNEQCETNYRASNSPITASFSSLLASQSTLIFPDGRGPDVIHAWTPRELVRRFCEELVKKYPCPVVIHLEDNEEYLTAVAVGRPYSEIVKLPEAEMDKIIPDQGFHPVKGKAFLQNAQGVTMTVGTLSRFASANIPSALLPPAVDERLFYPRPLNLDLRKELGIPDSHTVLAYTGTVHDGNLKEVRELYRAVEMLNQQGRPSVLLRTGSKQAMDSGDMKNVKHLGRVERRRLPEIMAAANILVQPGSPGPFNDERIPSNLPEYFAMGRPVILPRTNLGLKVEHGREGYVLERADADGIVRAVREISGNADLAEKLATEATSFYRSTLYDPALPNSLLAFYRLLLGDRKSA
jgi:glycosyltransferase involved in cell wall biosynthesis